MTIIGSTKTLRCWQTRAISPRDLRIAGILMLLVALIRPFLPESLGVACPLRTATGIPCPLCGMTTSVTAVVHLDLYAAFTANPAGIVAVGVAIYLLFRRPVWLKVSPVFIGISLVAMWVFELGRFGFL